jgi:hypothetical protein
MPDRADRHTRRRLRMVGAHCRPQARLRKRVSRSALSLEPAGRGVLRQSIETDYTHVDSVSVARPNSFGEISATIRTDVLNERNPRNELKLPGNPGVSFPSAYRRNHQSPFRCMEAGCGNLARPGLRYADDGGRPMTNLVFCHGRGRLRVERDRAAERSQLSPRPGNRQFAHFLGECLNPETR